MNRVDEYMRDIQPQPRMRVRVLITPSACGGGPESALTAEEAEELARRITAATGVEHTYRPERRRILAKGAN